MFNGTEEIPDTKKPVVNPAWRTLDRQVRSLKGKLRQEIEKLEHDLDEVKQRMKTAPRHLAWKDLPPTEKCTRLAPSRKRLLDTVMMIAYRSETAITNIVREQLARTDDGRALVRDLFRSEADILPDLERDLLEIRIHGMSNPRSNRAIEHLLSNLNEAELNYPGTRLRLQFTSAAAQPCPISVSDLNPQDQEV